MIIFLAFPIVQPLEDRPYLSAAAGKSGGSFGSSCPADRPVELITFSRVFKKKQRAHMLSLIRQSQMMAFSPQFGAQ